MHHLLRIVICLLSCIALSGCGRVNMFVGDSGNNRISRMMIDRQAHAALPMEVAAVDNPTDLTYIAVDRHPERVFFRKDLHHLVAVDFKGDNLDTMYTAPGAYIHSVTADVHNNYLYFSIEEEIDGILSILVLRLPYTKCSQARASNINTMRPDTVGIIPLDVHENWEIHPVSNPGNNGRLYWIESEGLGTDRTRKLYSSSLDSLHRNRKCLLDSERNPFLLTMNRFTIDVDSSRIYWTGGDPESDNQMIGYARIPESSGAIVKVERWITSDTLVQAPVGLAIDHPSRMLYCADKVKGWIISAELDMGEERVRVFDGTPEIGGNDDASNNFFQPVSIAVTSSRKH